MWVYAGALFLWKPPCGAAAAGLSVMMIETLKRTFTDKYGFTETVKTMVSVLEVRTIQV